MHWNKVLSSLLAATLLVASGCDKSTGPRTGSLTVTVNGLPSGLAASVSITTPKQTTLSLTASQTINDLDPGTYLIKSANAVSATSTFAPAIATSTVEVIAGDTPAQAVVDYNVITAILSISINGVPTGTTPFVSLTGGGITKVINASGVIGNLVPGSYSVFVGNVDSDELYGGTANPVDFNLVASTNPVPVTVTYAAITGRVTLTPSGLPSGATAVWDITGTNGVTRSASGTGPTTVTHLPPGQYSVVARNITFANETYGSASGASVVTVIAGQAAPVTTSYVARPPTFNLDIASAYLVQSVQSFEGGVPLIAGRDAYLRVFARANENNNASPPVRVRFYRGGQVVSTQTIAAPGTAVPTVNGEANAVDSWNAVISGAMIQPGTSLLVDVDPDNSLREVTESDNQYPANGLPLPLDIRTTAPLNVRFVPITTGEGNVGNVTQARTSELLSLTLRMHPMSSINADVRSTYTTANVFVDNDTNNAWSKILSEMDVIRVAEGSGRFYIGIVKNNGHSAWGGMGYVPGKSTVSIDYAAASELVAHELGHNWGRHHAPCGSAGGPDPSFPYAEGAIGRFGYDPLSGKILSSAIPDVMGYCWGPGGFSLSNPRQWVSDYTYTGVLNYRSTHPASAVAAPGVQECLIVWGRITSSGIVLEPAFNARTTPVLPERSGHFRLEAIDAAGNSAYAMSFDPQQVADGPRNERHFVFAVPVSQLRTSRLANLRVSGDGLSPAVIDASSETGTPAVSMTSSRNGFVRLQWNARANPLLVVRDPATSEIISLAQGGDVTLRTSRSALVVDASNGTGSVQMQVR